MDGQWTRETVADKAVDIYSLPNDQQPRFGVLFLHPLGLETLVDNKAYTRWFDEYRMVCLCPHSQRSWWTDRICPEFDDNMSAENFLLEHVMPLFLRWNLAPRKIAVMGISMGGQGALRLAFKHAEKFPVVAGISSAIEYHELFGEGSPIDDMYDSKEQCRQDTAIMHIPPYKAPPHIHYCIDPNDAFWYRGNDRMHEKMMALGVEHSCDLTTEAGGHSWEYFNAMAEPVMEFLYKGLDIESRRLL